MTTNQRISALRSRMAENHIDGCIIPSADPHMSEYVPDHWKTRASLSGFSGSAGTFALTQKESGLWTDGRYYVQAEKELSGSEVKLFRTAEPDCPKPEAYLAEQLPEGSAVGVNSCLFSAKEIAHLRKTFSEKGIKLVCDVDYANELWESRVGEEQRPSVSFTPLYLLDPKYAGKTREEKLAALREALAKAKVDAIAVSKVDNIAWLFNIRSADVPNNPVVTAYAYVAKDSAVLFTEESRIPPEAREALAASGVTLAPYEGIYPFLAGRKTKERILCDKEELNGRLFTLIEENPALTPVPGEDPIFLMKARKNETENQNTRNAYLKDGCALAEFYAWLFAELDKGTPLTEYDCAVKLGEFRHAQPLNRGDSFTAIVAYRENAAMMHYAPQKEGSKRLEKANLLLIDSGGQYLDGTTDITRTFALGPITDTERHDFTLTLKGSIALLTAVFKSSTSGRELDILCREHFWREGLDYRCGTGHGVGFMLNVHEGPQSFKVSVPFQEGMVVTIEPGVYREGQHGIRTENVVEIVKGEKTEYAQFLKFSLFTLFPIDTSCLDLSLLTAEETAWLDSYHSLVWEKLSPLVSPQAKEWLRKYTRPVAE